jgi:hypothetical protein
MTEQRDMKKWLEDRKKTQVAPKPATAVEVEEPTAEQARDILGGTYEQRQSEVKKMVVTMTNAADVHVELFGFWDGKLVRAATNSIERYYRKLKGDRLRESVRAKSLAEQAEIARKAELKSKIEEAKNAAIAS